LYLNASALFLKATRTAEQIVCAPGTERYAGKDDAVISVLFAVISAEAFINELAFISGDKSLHEVLSSADESRASLETMYQIAKLVLSGAAFRKGEPPFQDFHQLLRLRDAIVHFRPQPEIKKDDQGRTVFAETRIENLLRSKGILASPDVLATQYDTTGHIITDWIQRISTKAVALWACNSIAAIVRDILRSLPLPQDAVMKMIRDSYIEVFHERPTFPISSSIT
jgi:hypothetical protein